MGKLLPTQDWVEEINGTWVRMDGMTAQCVAPATRFSWAVQRPDGSWLSTSPVTSGSNPKTRYFVSANAAMAAADRTR